MSTAKKKPIKRVLARGQRPVRETRKVAPAKPRYSEQYERALKEYERGITQLQKKTYDDALETFKGITVKFSEEGEICDRARQYVSICQERLDAKNPRATGPTDHFHVGVYHLNRAETESAIKEFEKALHKQPGSDMVHYAIASAYALSGDKARAVAALQEAVRLNEKNRIYAQNDPDFDRIRDDHEFIHLVEPEEAGA